MECVSNPGSNPSMTFYGEAVALWSHAVFDHPQVATPTVLELVLDSGETLSSLQRVVCMGEPLSWRLVEIIMKQLPAVQIMNFYGSTETEARLFWPYQSCLVVRSPMMSIVMNYYEWSILGAKPSVIFRRSHPLQQCCNSFWAHVPFVWFSVDELWLWGEYHLYGAASSKPLASSICSSCRTTATSRGNPLAATRLLGYQSLRRWDLFWWCDVIRLLGKTWSHCHELCPAPPVGLVVSHRRSWKMATWAAGRLGSSGSSSEDPWLSSWVAGAGTHPAAAGGWLRWCWMCCCGRKGKWPLTDCGFRLSRFGRSRQTGLGSPNSRSSSSAFTTAHAKPFRSTTEATTSFQRKGRLDEFEDLRFRCLGETRYSDRISDRFLGHVATFDKDPTWRPVAPESASFLDNAGDDAAFHRDSRTWSSQIRWFWIHLDSSRDGICSWPRHDCHVSLAGLCWCSPGARAGASWGCCTCYSNGIDSLVFRKPRSCHWRWMVPLHLPMGSLGVGGSLSISVRSLAGRFAVPALLHVAGWLLLAPISSELAWIHQNPFIRPGLKRIEVPRLLHACMLPPLLPCHSWRGSGLGKNPWPKFDAQSRGLPGTVHGSWCSIVETPAELLISMLDFLCGAFLPDWVETKVGAWTFCLSIWFPSHLHWKWRWLVWT